MKLVMKIVFTVFIQIALWTFYQVKLKKEKLLITSEKKKEKLQKENKKKEGKNTYAE